MKVRKYNVTLTGISPMLQHNDNIAWADKMAEWLAEPENRKESKAGDDRQPGFKWIGSLYNFAGHVVIPSENIMKMLNEGGKKCGTGKGKGTFGRLTQTGLLPTESAWNLMVNGKEIATAKIDAAKQESRFSVHEELAKSLGFSLFVKRAKIGTSKHIRVRPLFENWSAQGTLQVTEDAIGTKELQMILSQAGAYAGIGDWRPSSPQSPGQYGRFTAEIEEVSK